MRLMWLWVILGLCLLAGGCDLDKSLVQETIRLTDNGSGAVEWVFWLEEGDVEAAGRFGLPVNEALAASFCAARGLRFQSMNKGEPESAGEGKPKYIRVTVKSGFTSGGAAGASLNPLVWKQVKGKDYEFSRRFFAGKAIADMFAGGQGAEPMDAGHQAKLSNVVFSSSVIVKGLILEKDVQPAAPVVKLQKATQVAWSFSPEEMLSKPDLAGSFKAKLLIKDSLDSRLIILALLLCVGGIIYSLVQTMYRAKNAVPLQERRKKMMGTPIDEKPPETGASDLPR